MSLFGFTDGSQSPDSGKLSCEAGQIHYASNTFGSWSMPLDSIRLIGEYTNEDGPHSDDYFLIFIGHANEGWRQASYYAEGRETTLATLEQTFPGASRLGLVNSTSFKSRVLWPPRHQGKPLFVFSQPQRSSGLLGRLATALDSKIEYRIAGGLD